MEFGIRVANRHILIQCVYPNVYPFFGAYRTNESTAPDMEIRTDESMIRAHAERIGVTVGDALDLSGAERLLMLKLISEELLSFDTLLMHGAVVAVDDAAYMFTAKSGTGKTTHIQSWLRNVEGAYVVNGDKPFIILRNADEPPLACGSPWAGKEKMQTNTMVPLKAIVLLERAEENRMERISFARAFPFLLQQVYCPEDPEKMKKALHLMQRLYPAVSIWRFQCNNFKDDCFQVAYKALTAGEA